MKYKVTDINNENRFFMVGSTSFLIISLCIFTFQIFGPHNISPMSYSIITILGQLYLWFCILYSFVDHTWLRSKREERFKRIGISETLKIENTLKDFYVLGHMKRNLHMFVIREQNIIFKKFLRNPTSEYRYDVFEFIRQVENLGISISHVFLDCMSSVVVIKNDSDVNLIHLVFQNEVNDNPKDGYRLIIPDSRYGFRATYFSSNDLLDRIKTNEAISRR